MILHTDNSKVEQLIKRPKQTDKTEFSDFLHALNQCQQKENLVDIRVKRVRGHTTRFEQQQCPTKREFARVEQEVRQKLREHVQRWYSLYQPFNSF